MLTKTIGMLKMRKKMQNWVEMGRRVLTILNATYINRKATNIYTNLNHAI